jgi:hypothetical protein
MIIKEDLRYDYYWLEFYHVNRNHLHITDLIIKLYNRIYIVGGVMISLLVLSEVDCEFEPCLGTTKDYKIGICCFSAKYAALRRKSKYWLARNQDNVSE